MRILHKIRPNGQSGQVSQFGWGTQDGQGGQGQDGGHGSELCKSINDNNWSLGNVVWCDVLQSGLVWSGLI